MHDTVLTPLAQLWQHLDIFGPYAGLAMLFLIGLPMLSLSRALLMLWQSKRVAATGIWREMLLQGVRVDVILLSLLALPVLLLALPLLLLAAFVADASLWLFWHRFNLTWITLAIAFLALLEIASPAFINEYDSRPNRLFIEYLKYPNEIIAMLWNGFRVHLVAGLLVTGLLGYLAWQIMISWQHPATSWFDWRLWLTWPILLLICIPSLSRQYRNEQCGMLEKCSERTASSASQLPHSGAQRSASCPSGSRSMRASSLRCW